MRKLDAAVAGALAAAAAVAAVAFAGGGPPPTEAPAPDLQTVVAHGNGLARVRAPAKRSDATIERAVRAARRAAIPKAFADARVEAQSLAASAGMRLGGPIGVSRDSAPFGYYDSDVGRFGFGRWCGRIVHRRAVRGSDGVLRHVLRSHRSCPVPRDQTVRLTVTFAAR